MRMVVVVVVVEVNNIGAACSVLIEANEPIYEINLIQQIVME